MEFNQIITLIKTISDSAITSFEYEEGGLRLLIGVNKTVILNEASHEVRINEVENEKCPGNEKTITSPMVGTFYASKKEGAQPFVSVGDTVKKGQIIGIVEAMKLMNEIESPYDGVVDEIFIQNKDMVEYGQPLMTIR